MNKNEKEQYSNMMNRLSDMGIEFDDAHKLRRISMTLHGWYEKECGVENGCIERDEATDKPYWLNAMTNSRSPVPDREKGALARLKSIMQQHPKLVEYVQTDPRGAALYILRKSDLNGSKLDAVYSRGVCVR